MNIYRMLLTLVALSCLTVGGCSGGEPGDKRPKGELSGKVTLNGQPMTKGTVCLTGNEGKDVALGLIESDGSFQMRYNQQKYIPVGAYKVTVAAAPALNPTPEELMKNPQKYNVPNPIPEKYRTVAATDLIAKIDEGSNPPLTIELK